MGVPIDIETGSDGKDDPAYWKEKFNSQGPEWRAEGEAELVQNNHDGKIVRKGGNVMTIVKAIGDDLAHSNLAHKPEYKNVVEDLKRKLSNKLKEVIINDLGMSYQK